jgi:hypothetical protein
MTSNLKRREEGQSELKGCISGRREVAGMWHHRITPHSYARLDFNILLTYSLA